MVNSALRPDASLGEVLASFARGTSDIRLGLATGAGVIAAASAVMWRPAGWFVLLNFALIVTAFGVWGIADREMHDASGRAWSALPRAILRAMRVVAAITGALAAGALMVVMLGIGLGRIIS